MNPSQNLFYLLDAVNMCASSRYDTCFLCLLLCWQSTQHWNTVYFLSFTLIVSDQTLRVFKHKIKQKPLFSLQGIMGKFRLKCD
jgi:hypothetical protein